MSLGDVQRLRAFALVLDLGSVSAAASVLGYTQSAVSQQLAALEREVGAALVDRAQRPLRPTPVGAALRPHVDRVLAALGSADAAVEDLRGGTPRLRLAAFGSALSSFVPAAVRDLRRAHPQLVVGVLQLETREAVERLRGGEADLAVVHHLPGVAVPETAGLRRRRLLVDHLHIVLPAGHRLARRDAVGLGELEGEPLVLPRRDTPAGRFRSLVEHLCAQAGFAPGSPTSSTTCPPRRRSPPPASRSCRCTGSRCQPPAGRHRPPADRSRRRQPRDRGARARRPRTPVVDDLLERLAGAAARTR